MKFILCILFIFSFFFQSFSQKISESLDLSQFFSQNDVNSNLTISSKSKIDSIYKWYLNNYRLKDKAKLYKEFVYRYNYSLEKLNKSGKVFSNNEISIYLNKLKDRILGKRDEKNRIHVYLVDFDQLNAFTNDFGSIYVNVGTIARLDNEKELILILAHEIAHILSRHSYKKENIDEHFEEKKKFNRINKITEAEYHHFSRKYEMEADSLAYILLNEAAISIEGLETLFDKLKHCNNPIYNSPIDLMTNFGVNSMSLDYLKNITKIQRDNFGYQNEKLGDSLSTHPSVDQRIEFYQKMSLNNSDTLEYKEIGLPYIHYKSLAALVMVKTLMSNQKYIESLYLTCQLLVQFPNSDYLIKNKLKNLILIDQDKYLNASYYVINEYKETCNNLDYLRFNFHFHNTSALDLNLLTIENINQALENFDSSYINRMLQFSYQFLYKYNPYLITSKNNLLTLKVEIEKYNKYYFDPISMYTSDQKEEVAKLKKEGFFLVEYTSKDIDLLNNFVNHFQDVGNFNIAINSYKSRRDKFEGMLTFDQFNIELDLKRAYRKNKKGTFIHNKPISDSSLIAIIQSDTYFLEYDKKNIKINYQKSLETEDLINKVLEEEKLYNINFTNSKNVSISENYLHSLLTDWIDETLFFSDLVYSKADEEIVNINSISRNNYFVYNLNIIQKKGIKYRSVYYELYFDVDNMGIVYVSKISSKRKPKIHMIRHYFYQSFSRKSI